MLRADPGQEHHRGAFERASVYNAFVDVVGVQGNIQLDQRSVLFLVPPRDPGVT
jgi:hypothetical protein